MIRSVSFGWCLVSLLVVLLALASASLPARTPQSPGTTAVAPPPVVQIPTPDMGVAVLEDRARAQRATTDRFAVPHDFQLHDRLPETGITFVHRITDESGRYYKPVHYDHGTGIACADVDGDGLADLYFVNQLGGNELWQNTGKATFRNITATAGVALVDRVSAAAAFADIDNDGDPDLFVTTVRGGNALFENDGQGHFTDISEAAGVDHVGHSSGAVFFDYDTDGLLDLFVANVGRYTNDERGRGGAYVGLEDAFSGHLHPERVETSILYRNLGRNRFTDVTDAVGLRSTAWSGDAAAADVNADGYPDLYVLNMQGADTYYENVAGERFVEKTAAYFPRTPWGSMGVKYFDADNDGRGDLLVTDMHSDMSVQVGPDREKRKADTQWPVAFLQGDPATFILGNALFHRGDTGFEERSDAAGVENYWPWGPSIGDVNADGWQDVFIASSMNFPFPYGINSMLLNNGDGTFLDSEFLLGIEPRRDGRTHTPWFDVDCAAPDAQCPPGVTGTVTIMAALGTRSAAWLDLDEDGDLDLVTNEFNAAPQVLLSDLAERRQLHWVRVVPVGGASNRDGLGAVVRVSAGGRVLTQWHDGKSGYLSQSALPLYFGLGESETIDRIDVQWPSGRRQTLTSELGVNSTIRVTEPR